MNEFNLIQIAQATEAHAETAVVETAATESHVVAETHAETSAEPKEAAHEGGGLSVQPAVLGFQALNFVILAVLLHKILYKPLLAIMQEREKKIRDGVNNAEKAEGMLKESNLIREDMMKRSQSESMELIEKGRKTGEKLKNEIIGEAQQEADKIVKNGHTLVEAEKAKTAQELKSMAVNLIMGATEKVLREKMTDAKDAKMIEESLKSFA